MNLRPVELKDSQRIWEIRNNEDVRKISGNPEFIELENHNPWFQKKYFENQDNLCFVLEKENNVVGYCRLDYDNDNDNYVISIAIDPKFQSKGLGQKLLSESLKKYDEGKNIIAKVNKENARSVKLFERNNFSLDSTDEDGNFIYKY